MTLDPDCAQTERGMFQLPVRILFFFLAEFKQDVLLSVINTNEGPLFINQSLNYDVAEYVRNLFPLFGAKESNAVASTYQSLGSALDQVNAIMGDC
jgi:hypothetical protein